MMMTTTTTTTTTTMMKMMMMMMIFKVIVCPLRADQHPGKFGDEFGHASREVMEARYWMLPYLYTLFHEAHTRGGTVVRPLHHE
nr:hypothetical protein BaRGS_020350 [Batillaria attramentaria]